MGERLTRAFFARSPLEVAPELLGCVVTHDGVSVRLSEVEAYDGGDDPASHAFRGRTKRNAVMFGPAGHLYVYFTYGMHWCANVVCGEDGVAGAVLLRAGEVVAGEDVARRRRGDRVASRDLARGPARLTQALGVGRAHDGLDLCAGPMSVGPEESGPIDISSGPRVGVAKAADRPWRFWVEGDPTVSAYRPHVPRRRTSRA
ncbi:MAG: DNA-3-methyladenine glycosylase [Propionibacteriales bacterium]|nr:DNA-3-methyladenine glycosylase [Propionibacteriales bacterium]